MSVIVDQRSCEFTTLAAALASGASTIIIRPGVYNESITLSNVTLKSDLNVFINGITVINATIIGGTYSGLRTLGNVSITDAVVSLVNTGILEITKSKILSLTNNNCASIYNNYIFAPIISTGGTLNIAENIFCSVNNLISITNTTARVLSNTVINNSEFTAYIADDTSVVQSSNNTFRVGSPSVISNGLTVDTNDDAWVVPGTLTTANSLNAYNVNGDNHINAQYTNVTVVTAAYATTPDDHTIIVTAPGGDITLTPGTEGQVIYVRNNSGSTINVNGSPLDNNSGAIYTYNGTAWELVATDGSSPAPPPPFYVNNSVFVDPVYGNNATAQPNNPALSASTIEYAVSIAPSTTAMIYVQPGTYTPASGFTTNNFYFSPDTVVNWAANDILFGGTSNIYGEGVFNLIGPGILFNTTGIITGDTVNQLVGSIGLAFSVSDSVIKFNNYNPQTNSNFLSTVVDIKQVTLPDVDSIFFTLTDSSVNIQLLTSTYTGVPGLSIFNTAGRTAIRVNNAVMNTNPRRIVNVLGFTDLRIGVISNVPTLGAGVGELTGYVGHIVTNTVEPIFNSPFLAINMSVGYISSTNASNFSLTQSNLYVNTWIIDNSTCTNWNLSDSSLNIGNMLPTSPSISAVPLFIISGNADINVGYLNSVSGSLFTINGDVKLYLGNVTIIGFGALTPITVNGRVTANMDTVNASGTTFIANAGEGSTYNIDKYVGTTLCNNTGSATFVVNNINNSNTTFFNNSTLLLTLVINGGVFGSQIANGTGPMDITVSGYVTNTGISSIIFISDPVPNKLHIKNIDATPYVGVLINIANSVSPINSDQFIKIDNLTLGTGRLLDYAGPSRLIVEADSIVASPVTQLFGLTNNAPHDAIISINNLICLNGVVWNTNFNNNTNFRFNIANGRVATLINIAGDAYIPGSNAGIFITLGDVDVTTTSNITAEARLEVSAKSVRSPTNTIFSITGVYGTYMRFTGRYSVLANNPAISLSITGISVNTVVEGLYLANAEFSSAGNGIVLTVNVVLGFTVDYRFRVFSVVSTGYTSNTNAGVIIFLPIQSPLIYTPLPL